MFPVVVPSIGRPAGCETWKWLSQTQRRVMFAVHADEVDAYRAGYPGARILQLSEGSRRHAGKVRAEIIEVMSRPFHFVDDDIRLSWKKARTADEVFDTLEMHLNEGVSIAGLGQQLFSNYQMETAILRNGDLTHWNKFVATVYAIDPEDFRDCPLERLPVYEDVALVIHGARKNGVIVSYCATHNNVSPMHGGCNSWRDKDVTLASLHALVEMYPDICSIRQTNMTTHSQNIGIGLRVAWKKLPQQTA